jgi:hypothetical protein
MIGVKQMFSNKRIGIPQIGAGLARGDWNIIKGIIEKVFCDDTDDVTIVYYQPNTSSTTLSALLITSNNIPNSTSAPQSILINNKITSASTTSMNYLQPWKKQHGKRMCKVCEQKHRVTEMYNILHSVWVCRENCLDDLIKKLDNLKVR